MSTKQYSNASLARRRILAIIVVTLAVVAGMLLFGAYPICNRVAGLNLDIGEVDSALIPYLRLLSQEPLSSRVERELRLKTEMSSEWDELVERVQTFSSPAKLADLLASSEEGRIDYKVALFDARQCMSQFAGESDVAIPSDLGMTETIGTDEVMASRLWQLATNVSLIGLLIDSGAIAIDSILLLDPIDFPVTALGDSSILKIYPVKFTAIMPFDALVKLIRAFDKNERFFAMQRLMVKSIDPKQPDILRVKAVSSALLFRDDYMYIEDAAEEWDDLYWEDMSYEEYWEGWR